MREYTDVVAFSRATLKGDNVDVIRKLSALNRACFCRRKTRDTSCSERRLGTFRTEIPASEPHRQLSE